MYGAGGGTTSYAELADTDVLLLWGSNARETHPVMFHHMLRGVRRGARLVVIDPRRTSSAAFAHDHLPVRVGTDLALANAMAHVIIAEDLYCRDFVAAATSGFDAFRDRMAPYTPEAAAAITGVPADAIRSVARAYARAHRAIICWTLGITEHHDATSGVHALCNLANLAGHVGRYGSGLNPLRGQNNVQGGGDMGAIPNRLPGGADVEDAAERSRFEAEWDRALPPRRGMHQSLMFEAMERGELRAAYVIGENPLVSEAHGGRIRRLLEGLDLLIVQDVVPTQTAELADVFLPSALSWCECEGTVTNSERRVQRVRRALDPPGQARDDIFIVQDLAAAMGAQWSYRSAEDVWDEVRRLSPRHRGMTWARLDACDGLQWPCPDEGHPGTPFLHARLWQRPIHGPRAPFVAADWTPPVETPDEAYPLLLTTGRRLQSFNTGTLSRGHPAAREQDEQLCVSPADSAAKGLAEGDLVRVRSRRGAVRVPLHVDASLPPGLCFLTLHHPDRVPTNLLTLDAWDPQSGTAEFKATAVAVEKVAAAGAWSEGDVGAETGSANGQEADARRGA